MLNQLGGKEPTSTLFEVFYSDKYTSTNYSVVVNFVSKHGVKLWYEDEAIGQLSRQRMTPVFLFDGKNAMQNLAINAKLPCPRANCFALPTNLTNLQNQIAGRASSISNQEYIDLSMQRQKKQAPNISNQRYENDRNNMILKEVYEPHSACHKMEPFA